MPDDKKKRGAPDRKRVAGEQPWEVRHVAKKLGVSQEAVRKAIKAVGPSRKRVEDYLK